MHMACLSPGDLIGRCVANENWPTTHGMQPSLWSEAAGLLRLAATFLSLRAVVLRFRVICNQIYMHGHPPPPPKWPQLPKTPNTLIMCDQLAPERSA